jgi:tetratricopeptide (TPR) repeat protein
MFCDTNADLAPSSPSDDQSSDDYDEDLIREIDKSLLIGMNGEEGDTDEDDAFAAVEEYSESMKELLQEAQENFKRMVDTSKAGSDQGVDRASTLQDGLRMFRQQANQGIQHMIRGDLNTAMESFDEARSANKTQLLTQRGMALYLLGRHEEASAQFQLDVSLIENRNLKLFKATDSRLWWSASLWAQGRDKEAKDALDICNTELEESRYVMTELLRYVLCSMFFLLFLFMMASLSLLSIYCCLFAFSDTNMTSNHHTPPPPPQSINQSINQSPQYSTLLITLQVLQPRLLAPAADGDYRGQQEWWWWWWWWW